MERARVRRGGARVRRAALAFEALLLLGVLGVCVILSPLLMLYALLTARAEAPRPNRGGHYDHP